jgi:hypothetical protein
MLVRTSHLASLVLVLALSIFPLATIRSVGATDSTTNPPYSWNPAVTCTPLVVRITDITGNKTGSDSFSASPFIPGITTSVTNGVAKRWLTPGATPPGWASPGPPCIVNNSKGTTSLFVQINGVERNDLTDEDFATTYGTVNGGSTHMNTSDTTFNLFDPTVVPHYFTSCTVPTDPSCTGRIHAEIDHDWKAAGYCGTGTMCDNSTLGSQTVTASTMIDVQGFVYWDPENLDQSWHQFSGWEIHPLTAWKLSSSSPPPRPPNVQTRITANFNSFPLEAGDLVWFSSVMKLKSPTSLTVPLALHVTGQEVLLVLPNGTRVGLGLPNTDLVFDPSAQTATTAFDPTANKWVTIVPARFSDDVFLSGLAFRIPTGGLPGNIRVTWSGTVSSSTSFSIEWRWAAAVYPGNHFSMDYNSLGVKPVHSTSLDAYHYGDMAGTPENFKTFVIAGATGGGGSNFTGGYSGTATATSTG